MSTRAQTTASSTGWQLPLLSPQVSAVFEKELRYAMRNAQLRMMALMPLVLVGIRFVRGGNRLASANVSSNAMASFNSFAAYADGLLVAGGVLYIFLIIGNWLSIRFPKRLQFGKRMNASGVTGFLLIPILLVLAAAPILAVTVGYYARSFMLKYATLSVFAAAAVALYFLLIKGQGRSLARHEQEILEAVGGKTED
jgi:small-conductance mechanosensitive channel